MQVANNSTELEKQFARAPTARAAFGPTPSTSSVLPLPATWRCRFLGDHHGHLIHCFERECSIQRRRTEGGGGSPSPLFLDGQKPELAQRMYAAGVAAAKAFGYAKRRHRSVSW